MRDVTLADWLLALIPAPLVAGAVVGAVSSLSLAATIGAGSVPATGLVGYALFCSGPR